MKFLTIVVSGLVSASLGCITTKTVSTSAGVVVLRQPEGANNLPAGATFRGRLATPLVAASAHAGDPVTVSLTDALKAKHGVTVLPSGTNAYGHVIAGAGAGGIGSGIAVAFDSLVVGGTMHTLDANIIQTGTAGVSAAPVVPGTPASMPSVAVATLLSFAGGATQIPAGTVLTLVVASTVRLTP